jgi:hypothetical protein
MFYIPIFPFLGMDRNPCFLLCVMSHTGLGLVVMMSYSVGRYVDCPTTNYSNTNTRTVQSTTTAQRTNVIVSIVVVQSVRSVRQQ